MTQLKTTIAYGAAMTALGIGAYVTAEKKSPTALIPTFIGLPVLLTASAGVILFPLRKPIIGFSMGMATLALAGTAPGAIKLIRHLKGGPAPARPRAAKVQAAAAAMSAGLLVSGVLRKWR
jgi:hypothetical protein